MAGRIRQGGHVIPEPVIRRHFASGLVNFRDHYKMAVNDWLLYARAAQSNCRFATQIEGRDILQALHVQAERGDPGGAEAFGLGVAAQEVGALGSYVDRMDGGLDAAGIGQRLDKALLPLGRPANVAGIVAGTGVKAGRTATWQASGSGLLSIMNANRGWGRARRCGIRLGVVGQGFLRPA